MATNVFRRRKCDLDPLRLPQEGTKLRELYDRLASGEIVPQGNPKMRGYWVNLRDFYFCEFEHIRKNNPGKGRPEMHMRLIGRWDGDELIPIERINYA